MKQSVLLTITSLLTILFMSLHVAGDIVLGFEKGGLWNLLTVPLLVTWLYGALVLAERRSGYVIVLLGSLLGALVPVLHFRATGGVAGGRVAQSSGAFFWVWSLIALGVCAVLSVILSVHGWWKLQRDGSRGSDLEGR